MTYSRTTVPSVPDNAARLFIIFALAVAMSFAGIGVAAQDGGLFKPVEEVPAEAQEESRPALRSTTRIPTRGGDTIRHREARVDFARLAAVKADLEAGRAATLELNLFDDVVYNAVDLHMAPTSSGGFPRRTAEPACSPALATSPSTKRTTGSSSSTRGTAASKSSGKGST